MKQSRLLSIKTAFLLTSLLSSVCLFLRPTIWVVIIYGRETAQPSCSARSYRPLSVRSDWMTVLYRSACQRPMISGGGLRAPPPPT